MKRKKPPVLIGEATLTRPSDIYSVLLTINSASYRFYVGGELMSSGWGWVITTGMVDDESSTIITDRFIFINVRSFDYATFRVLESNRLELKLYSDDMVLSLISMSSYRIPPEQVRKLRIYEAEGIAWISEPEED